MNTKFSSTQTISLTENEKCFLKQVITYDKLEDQVSDNFSNAGIEEAAQQMGSLPAAKGLIGSLTAKGVGFLEDDLFWINPEMIESVWASLGLPSE